MSVIQKILLAAACVFYALTIYGFFNLELYLIIVFFLLHSLCLILFTYRTYAGIRRDDRMAEAREQEIGLELAEKDKEVVMLQESIEKKDEEYISLSREYESLKIENERHQEKIKALEEEKKKISKQAEIREEEDRNDGRGLLPPVEDESDETKTVNIIEIANIAKNELEESARKANLVINVSSSTDELMVKAHPGRLIVLFRNIIDNSIKYMNRPGSLVITISTINDDIFIVLKDTGDGLNEAETKHIFELNYQGSNRISGNGLGLAQAKAIVEYYGGTIYAKSTEGKGMGIYIQLPA